MESSTIHFLKSVLGFLFFIPFVSLPILFFNVFRYEASGRSISRFPVISLLFAFGSVLSVFMLRDAIDSHYRDEVMTFAHSANDAQVSVNGQVAADPERILKALRWVTWVQPHHSLPKTSLHVVINARNGTMELDLARDSGRPLEYWVFYPRGGSVQAGSEIGRIESNAFDAY